MVVLAVALAAGAGGAAAQSARSPGPRHDDLVRERDRPSNAFPRQAPRLGGDLAGDRARRDADRADRLRNSDRMDLRTRPSWGGSTLSHRPSADGLSPRGIGD